ncbi:MAG: hypothetical protein MMC23_010020 [Stictis urceolatum]|nr:hypothetical protein [Stictis urceolata]
MHQKLPINLIFVFSTLSHSASALTGTGSRVSHGTSLGTGLISSPSSSEGMFANSTSPAVTGTLMQTTSLFETSLAATSTSSRIPSLSSRTSAVATSDPVSSSLAISLQSQKATSTPGATTDSTVITSQTTSLPVSTSSGAIGPTQTPVSSSTLSTTTPVPTTTFTVFPTVSVSTITDSTVTTGSHVDITTSGKVTHVPALPDSKHGCWFCPPGPGGFVIPGFAIPGVYPPGGPPAGFPTPFPAITVGPNGDPTYDDEPTSKPTNDPSSDPTSRPTSSARSSGSSTASSCGATTVTDCSTSLSYGVNTAGSTTATSTVSSCSARSGCSITGSTTISSTASTSTGCWTFDYSFDSGTDPDSSSDDSLAKRNVHGISGRRLGVLDRRGPSEPVSVVGAKNKCTLSMNGAAATVTIPAYPGANDLEGHNPAGAVWWYVPTTSASAGGCPTLTMTQFPDAAALTAAPVMTGTGGSGGTYKLGGIQTPLVNVDHVYELKFFKNFVDSLVDGGQITCTDFNDFFMAEDLSIGNGVPRFQALYNAVPGNDNPDFCGMDSRINAVKGWLFNNKLTGLPNTKKLSDDNKIQLLNEIAAAVDVTNNADIAALLQKTNTRVYEAWRGIDNLVAAQAACNAPAPKPSNSPNAGWADVYSSYMTSLFSTQNVQISRQLNSMTNTKFYKSPGPVTKAIKAFTDAYPTGKWTYDANALLAWPTTSAANIQRRDAPACSRPTSVSTPASSSAAHATSTPLTTTTGPPSSTVSTTSTSIDSSSPPSSTVAPSPTATFSCVKA